MSLKIQQAQKLRGGLKLKGNNDLYRGIALWLDATNPASANSVSPGGSIHFTGASLQYLTIPTDTSLALGTNDFTIEFWAYETTRAAYPTLFSYDNAASGTSPTSFFISSTGNVLMTDGGSGWSLSLTWSLPSLNAWHHYALVRNNNTFTLFIDGTSVATGTSTYSLPQPYGSMQIGSGQAGPNLDGYITNYRIVNGTAVYTSNFTPQRTRLTAITNTVLLLSAMDNSSLVADSSSGHLTVTNHNGATWSGQTPLVPTASGSTWYDLGPNHYDATLHGATFVGNSFNFDYTQSQYADIPAANMFTGNNMTAIGWVYVRSYQTWSRLFDFGNGAGGVNVLVAVTAGGLGTPAYSTVGSNNLYSSQQLPLDHWAQLVATQSGTTGKIYINGQQVVSGTNAGIDSVVRNYNYIGRSNFGGDAYLNGKIASLRIWNRTLDPEEITADYNTMTGALA
jgi:hypothetical protein